MRVAQRVVLLVNGHADSRTIYRTLLEHRGYTVFEAEDADGGLRLAELVKPDLLVIDVTFSDDENLRLIRKLRSDEGTRGVAVIATTASVVPETEQKAREAGCTTYFVQPLPPQTLADEVERLIGAPADE
jgi:two-component system, OmpR family, phosphate regulon response regulator PhoB